VLTAARDDAYLVIVHPSMSHDPTGKRRPDEQRAI
jgi:hypothetical protein